MNGSVYLTLAIIAEVLGTSALRAADGMTKFGASALGVVSYLISIYLLSLALRTIPLGILYAIWAGAGIVATVLIGLFYFHQKLDMPASFGIALIMAGVIVINLFSVTKTLPE